MELIKDFGVFKTESVKFIANVREAWSHATVLSVSAVQHYHETKSKEMVDHLLNIFAEANGGFLDCFEKMLYTTTNLKIRQDETDLTKAIWTKSKGNMPEDCFSKIATVEKEGLRRFEKAAKTKKRASSWNNDGAPKPRQSQSTAADMTHLKTTDMGTSLVDAVKTAEGLDEAQKKAVEELAKQFNSGVEAIASGEEAPDLTKAGSSEGASLADTLRAMTSHQGERMAETIRMLDDIARVKGSDSVEASINAFHKNVTDRHAKIAGALEALALADSASAEEEEADQDEEPAAA